MTEQLFYGVDGSFASAEEDADLLNIVVPDDDEVVLYFEIEADLAISVIEQFSEPKTLESNILKKSPIPVLCQEIR